MKTLYATLSLLALAAAAWPEFPRYAAERRLYTATAVLRLALTRPQAMPNPAGAVAWAQSAALDAAGALPGDWRPLNIAATAALLRRQPAHALALYRRALELGERPEIDVNIGRTYATLGRVADAQAAFLRAGWISPPLLGTLPGATQEALASEVASLARALEAGALVTLPTRPTP